MAYYRQLRTFSCFKQDFEIITRISCKAKRKKRKKKVVNTLAAAPEADLLEKPLATLERELVQHDLLSVEEVVEMLIKLLSHFAVV